MFAKLSSICLSSLLFLAQPVFAKSADTFSGHAHWYGGHFQGKRTASGAIFDKNKLTAAHPSLPFGTKVKVKSLHTGKTVVVVVNDRCPALKVRCIDLSEGAARKLGIWPAAPCAVECAVVRNTKTVPVSEKESSHRDAELANTAE